MGIRSQNNPLAAYLDVFSNTGTDAVTAAPPPTVEPGIQATGGIISDWTDPSPGDIYRAHIFTSSGAFNVTALSTNPGLPDNVDILVVAGGGGGGGGNFPGSAGGGGGAGGLRYLPNQAVTANPYSIVIGAGGNGAQSTDKGTNGGPSTFNAPGANSFPAVTSTGGGAGGIGYSPNSADGPGNPGGSGGSAGNSATEGTGNAGGAEPRANPTTEGYPGGDGTPYGNGGGGAGGQGSDRDNKTGGPGGVGLQFRLTGPPASDDPQGAPGPSPGGGWFAGGGGGGGQQPGDGGGGGGRPSPERANPWAGGGAGGPSSSGPPGIANLYNRGTYATGGGGGAGGEGGSPSGGAAGGPGILIVRYKIGSVAANAKATGGAISFYGDKTIHTFTNSGDFTVTDSSAVAISYVAVAGGGGGAGRYNEAGGGGGAGGVMTNIPGFMPATQSAVNISPGAPNKVTVTVGGGGVSPQNTPGIGAQGTNTTLVCSPSSLNITATGGGYGGISFHPGDNAIQNGGAGGSGGGGAEAAGSAGPASPSGQGNAGGTGSGTAGSTENSGGGGGGAGAVGGNAPGNANGGAGGVGKQLPAIFQNPVSRVGTPGPSGTYWIAGGGGGGTTTPGPSGGAGGAGGAGGGGAGGTEPGPSGGSNGLTNTGGGGGSSEGSSGPIGGGYFGGSGIVLIAYPS